ncbi:hypothetical protein K9L97_00335 [Candidatus Woesearchaeota archaeon]|nr:hypothetical protein [Candidatus Woesearchaeota archaeon]
MVDEDVLNDSQLKELYILLNDMKKYAHENDCNAVLEYKKKMGTITRNVPSTHIMKKGSSYYFYDGARNAYQNSVSKMNESERDRRVFLDEGDEFFDAFERKLKKMKVVV